MQFLDKFNVIVITCYKEVIQRHIVQFNLKQLYNSDK